MLHPKEPHTNNKSVDLSMTTCIYQDLLHLIPPDVSTSAIQNQRSPRNPEALHEAFRQGEVTGITLALLHPWPASREEC